MVRYVLSLPSSAGKFFLSERVSQDPLENYFGKQRIKGVRYDNPNAKQCLQNASSLRLQGSIAMDPVRGNCRRKRSLPSEVVDDTKLPRRQKKKYN